MDDEHPLRPARAIAITILLASTATGCTTVSHYVRDRGLDLMDAIPVSGGVGLGVSAEARVTRFLGVGVGYAVTWRAGFDEGRFGPLWRESEVGVPIVFYERRATRTGAAPPWVGGDPPVREGTTLRRMNTWLLHPGGPDAGLPPPFASGDSPWVVPHASPWDWFHVEVGAVALLAGVRVGVSIPQWLDFLAGIADFDPAGDD